MDGGNRKPEESPPDPQELAKLLELELIQKRSEWQQKKQRLGALRVLSFLFLFFVIVAALLGFWFFFASGQMNERKAHSETPSSSPSPRP